MSDTITIPPMTPSGVSTDQAILEFFDRLMELGTELWTEHTFLSSFMVIYGLAVVILAFRVNSTLKRGRDVLPACEAGCRLEKSASRLTEIFLRQLKDGTVKGYVGAIIAFALLLIGLMLKPLPDSSMGAVNMLPLAILAIIEVWGAFTAFNEVHSLAKEEA